MLKALVKKVIFYDKIYDVVKHSFVYQAWKKLNGQIANFLYGEPSKDFFVIGVTGTNGKTTTANLIHKILNDNLAKTVMISTANIKVGNEELKNVKKMTSLDIYDLQSTLAIAKDSWCKVAVLEVSSHGMDQARFEGTEFDCAVLTNITHDHLDYHGTMQHYIDAKKRLFSYVLKNNKANKYAVLPADDAVGRKWFEELAFDKKVNFSITWSSMLKAEKITFLKEGTELIFSYLGKSYTLKTHLVGKFNVLNILAAIGVATNIWVGIEKAIASVEGFEGVEWRMEKIEKDGISYFIDFAHSPDALEKTLEYLYGIKWAGRLIVTFGAPGVRDKTKRPEMWKIVDQYADIAIATDDDPDTENRLIILHQLTQDMKNKTEGKNLFILPERSLAIKFATEIARTGDILMFAGKGHEAVQLTNFGKRKWSDKEEVLKNLK